MNRAWLKYPDRISLLIKMECKKESNLQNCNCTYPCSKKGVCCDCLRYHLAMRQLPACCFPPEAEKTYDRSFENFARAWGLNG